MPISMTYVLVAQFVHAYMETPTKDMETSTKVKSMVLTWNSMGIAVKIRDKCYSCCIGHSASPREICPISNTTLMIFIPNFTATHAITYVYLSYSSKFMKSHKIVEQHRAKVVHFLKLSIFIICK